MITIVTGGKFWPQPGYGMKWPPRGGGNYAGGMWDRRPPVIHIDAIKEEDQKICVIVTGIEDA
jgi:hypothetical protein